MKKLQLIVIALFVCYLPNLFSQNSYKIMEQVKDKKSKPVFFQLESNNKQALNEQSEKIFLKQLYNTSNFDEFRKIKEYVNDEEIIIRSYDQYYKGLKVMEGSCIVRSKNNNVVTVNGKCIELNIDIQPKITQQQLMDFILDAVYTEQKIDKSIKTKIEVAIDKKELVICENYKNPNKDDYHLAYKVYVSSNQPFIRCDYFIDAITGKFVGLANLVCTLNSNGSAQTVYSGTKPIVADSYNSQYRLRESSRNATTDIQTLNLNHYLEWETNAFATDIFDNDNNWTTVEHQLLDIAHDIHWATEKVIDYWKIIHNRNSLDGNGMTVKSYVNYGDYWDNAGWFGYDGYPIMCYGEGLNKFNYKLASLDVVAHETGHAICQYSSPLYSGYGESGALAEGLSDIWGAVIENWAMPNSPPKNKWLIGEEIVKVGTNLRNMSNPNGSQTPSPDTYGGTYWGTAPYAYDPHKHCTVLDYWFYLLSDGGSGTNDPPLNNAFSVTGIGITKAAKIVYETEKFPLSSGANFMEMRATSISVARTLYGCGSTEEIAVTKAWYAVGVGANYGPPTLSITGASSICTASGSNTYTVSGVPNGVPITWSVVMPNGIATYQTNGNDVLYLYRTGSSNGLVVITASITICGIPYSASKSVNVGSPYTLWSSSGCTYPEAQIELGVESGPCNYQCYSTSISKWWCAAPVYNATSVTWQKVASIPSTYNFWSGSWSGNNNFVNILFKGANQYVELKTTITNACNTSSPLIQYYCFNSNNTQCSGNLRSTDCESYTVNLNPESKQIQIKKKNTNDCNVSSADLQIKTIQIVDKVGNIIKEQNYLDDKSSVFELNLNDVKKDIYFVVIQYNDFVESHQIAIFK